MTTVHYISLQSSYAKYLCTTVLTADLQRRSNNPNSAYQPSHIQKIWSPLQPPSRRRETGAEIRQTHRHRIDKYLDTLLANQPISDGEATDRCQRRAPQDGGLPELIVARSCLTDHSEAASL